MVFPEVIAAIELNGISLLDASSGLPNKIGNLMTHRDNSRTARSDHA